MIRQAATKDLESILNIYDHARKFMASVGNQTQWGHHYPQKELLQQDITKKQLYVIEDEQGIHGVFAFMIGEDITYHHIEDGHWLSNERYGVIHRIASDGKIKGIFQQAIAYCEQQIAHLRIDTHADNKIMQHLILKNGFKRCGIIYVADKSPRIAYEKVD